MVKTENELMEAVKYDHHITKEITDTLIELDALPSTGTQVYLNDILVGMYNRVVDANDDVIIEVLSKDVMTSKGFIEWVENNFTEYSAKMFKESVGK